MPYCISEVRHRAFPSTTVVESALAPLGLPLDDVVAAFRGYICPIAPAVGRGYGTDLAEDLRGYLEKAFQRDGLRPTRNRRFLSYSRSLTAHADLGVIHERSNRAVFVEIGFNPDYERHLLHFQIGASEGTMACAVLILSIEPRSIDATLGTMPSYEEVTRFLDVLRPSYPLVAVGLRGSHAA